MFKDVVRDLRNSLSLLYHSRSETK